MTKSTLVYEIPKFERSKMDKRDSIDLANHLTRLCLHDSVIENVSDFNDFQVFRAEPTNREEADFLHSLRMTATHYDFWTEVLRSINLLVIIRILIRMI